MFHKNLKLGSIVSKILLKNRAHYAADMELKEPKQLEEIVYIFRMQLLPLEQRNHLALLVELVDWLPHQELPAKLFAVSINISA